MRPTVTRPAALLAFVLASCAAPREAPARHDTLFVADIHAAPATAALAPASAPDTGGYILNAYVGWTQTTATTLPELAIVGPGGRMVGYDPVTGKIVEQVPGGVYESDPALDDDSGSDENTPPSRDTSTADPVIDVRTIRLAARPGDVDTLLVTAHDSGTFDLTVGLDTGKGPSFARRFAHLALRAGEVRRIPLTVAGDTLVVPGSAPPPF